MTKLKMLQPRLKTLDPMKERGIKTISTLKRKQKANGRTLALDGAAWRKLRALVLAEQPLCPECVKRGLLVSATEVDHQDNDPTNNDRANLVGLCKPCHSRKTNLDMGHAPKTGFDEHGNPLDPAHPWNVKNHEEPTGSNRLVPRCFLLSPND